jgi:hypothetical protein
MIFETREARPAKIAVRMAHSFASHREPPPERCETRSCPELLHERLAFEAISAVAPPAFDLDDWKPDILQFRTGQVVRRWSSSSHTLLQDSTQYARRRLQLSRVYYGFDSSH